MTANMGAVCDDGTMQQVLAIAGEDPVRGIATIDQLLGDFPGDARLHFLKGSMLIGLKRFIGAHQAMQRAVELAPDFHLARFQLGFFELTSGEADTAIATWQPLKILPDSHYLRLFVDGLEQLAADRFEQCVASLRAGIAVNAENVPLNNDMQLIIEKCTDLLAANPTDATGAAGEEVSATSLLLGASAIRPTTRKH